MDSIPVNVVSGSLGAGKTTVILNLVKQLDKKYKIVWLKNEYGDVSIDSELAKESAIQTTEILNGCLCCVLIGKLSDAIEEILKNFKLDRLIIETAGTAYPYPIIAEIGKLKILKLDSVCSVIDCLNFYKFNDTSEFARSQATYIDIVILNKHELLKIPELDRVLDSVYEMYTKSAVIKSNHGVVSNELLLGFDHKLKNFDFNLTSGEHHHEDNPEVISFLSKKSFSEEEVVKKIETFNFLDIYRIKVIFKSIDNRFYLLNWVLGRYDISELNKYKGDSKFSFMGKDILAYQEDILKLFK